MFNNFTESARKILINAKLEMQSLKHPYVGSEHFLLAVLKDKNDVEIYEGDIVKVEGSSNNDAEINEVVFYRGAFCFTNRKKIYPLFTGLNYCCEVIGNVWENGDLLNDSKKAKED